MQRFVLSYPHPLRLLGEGRILFVSLAVKGYLLL